MIIEWNTHIFSSDEDKFPFHPRAVYRPRPEMRFADPLDDYLKRMKTEGIDRAVLVHPEPYGDDHSLVLDCLEREPDIFKITSLFYPSDEDGPARLKSLVATEPRVIATRFHRVKGKDEYFLDFTDPGVEALWETADSLGILVELHIGSDFALSARRLIEAFPNTPVLIDHLAEPHTANGVEFAHVLDLANLDNVYMKLSGLNHFKTDEPLYESALPFTRVVSDAFGADRMVWGSGSPIIVETHLAHWSESERAKVLGENLKSLLGF
ncbi:MAG: amidohydrolase [Chloroflexi bacterium]|nr:amidohydrolase [Chloroflexota bacterium]